ncbi:MAG: penicillin-binding protein [Actinobacteria bacterium]|nr:penicillin-binding protein [Actinomycetota bacterium]
MSTSPGGGREHHGFVAPVLTVVTAAAVALVLLIGLLAAVGKVGGVGKPPPETLVAAVAEEYLGAWERQDVPAMRALVADPAPAFEEVTAGVAERLQVRDARFRPGPAVVGDDDTATVPFEADLDLAGLGTWSYRGRLELVLAEPDELPPAPEVVAGGGEVASGEAAPDDTLPVGAADPDGPRWAVSWSPATVHPALQEGLRLDRSRARPAREPILAVDGAPLTGPDSPSLPALSAQLLGSVGTLDEEAARARGLDYAAGDVVGVSGLQEAFDAQLGGEAAGEVQLLGPDGTVAEVLEVFPGASSSPVTTTIDPRVQAAAEAALAEAPGPSALVAVDATTGQVRAVANRPVSGFNRALAGQYPPGSTFKVVTATALLQAGITPDTPVSCPARASVGGFSFSNAGGEVLGDIPFRTAFFRSCNTAFVQLAEQLQPDQLRAAAEGYGFNGDWELPVPVAVGSFPEASGPVDHAAAALGQGRVTASPLQMATVAAGVASGAWHPPSLVVPPAALPAQVLPGGVAPTLQELMRLVVAEGTGTEAQVPGVAVAGKTGTAEYGTGRPPRTHAWFIGFRGDLAFSVLVEGGGFGGSVAAPLAQDFLTRLP